VSVTDPLMGARRVGLLALLAVACVGTNPRWDATDDAGHGDSTVGTDDDMADATSDGSTAGDDGSSGIAESSWTGSGESSSGSPTTAGECDEGKTSCAGECKDTSKDRRACGPDCVDCRELFDSKDAVCEAGECRDDGGPGDDD